MLFFLGIPGMDGNCFMMERQKGQITLRSNQDLSCGKLGVGFSITAHCLRLLKCKYPIVYFIVRLLYQAATLFLDSWFHF